MSDRALVLSVDEYNITDDKGVVNRLLQMWYVNDYRESSATERGSKPIKMLVTPEVFAQAMKAELPALFDLDLRSRPGKGNAAALTVVGMTYISTPDLFTPSSVPVKKAA